MQKVFCGECGTAARHGQFCGECGASLIRIPNVGQGAQGASTQAPPDETQTNPYANWALGFGVASAIFFEFLIPNIVAIVLGVAGLSMSTKLAAKRAKKTGMGKSLAGIILGSLYFIVFVLANAFGVF